MAPIRNIASIALVAAALAGSSLAMAQQQPQPQPRTSGQATTALEQAWHQCLQWVDQTAPRTGENDAQRTAQFKACMTQRGVTR